MVTYRPIHDDNLQPAIGLRHKVSRSRERHRTGAHQAPIQRRVFSDAFSEWSPLWCISVRSKG